MHFVVFGTELSYGELSCLEKPKLQFRQVNVEKGISMSGLRARLPTVIKAVREAGEARMH